MAMMNESNTHVMAVSLAVIVISISVACIYIFSDPKVAAMELCIDATSTEEGKVSCAKAIFGGKE